jgi:hypothetical protein
MFIEKMETFSLMFKGKSARKQRGGKYRKAWCSGQSPRLSLFSPLQRQWVFFLPVSSHCLLPILDGAPIPNSFFLII